MITFDPQSDKKRMAKWDAARQMRENGLKSFQVGPIMAEVWNHTAIPRSCSRARKNALNGQPCDKRPDIDNLCKFYFDVLNGIAYTDDRQITTMVVKKRYSDDPRVEIILKPDLGDEN